jgi:feruloyl esterase
VRRGAIGNNWGARHLLDANDREIFTPAKLALLHRAVMASCDRLDGLKDGILSDPRQCHFPPERLACREGAAEGDDCLNRTQVAAAKALYGGPRNSKGERLTPGGVPYGSELTWRGTGDREVTNVSLQHLVFDGPRPGMTYRDFNWDTDIEKVRAQAALLEPYAPGTDPDLSQFHARGGKLIAYHGWADGIPPTGLLDYYARVHHREGGLDATRAWFRVFMVPGMYHCRGGDAPNEFDMLPAMIDWVESGRAPDGIVATQFEQDRSVKRTRPLYAYPTVARYKGAGDVNDAASWRPVRPRTVPDDRIDWIWAAKAD